MHFTIVSYTFPPSTEIGGRRWAKFSKHLANKGHEVTVICANDIVNKEFYEKEFQGLEVRVLPKCYPEWLSGFTRSLWKKLMYLIYTRILSPFTKQNFFDRGYAWKNPMLNELENIHSNKAIDVLIVTGAPFSLLYYGSLFKKRHKEVQYVGDLRDPWTWGSYYGIGTLLKTKKKYQEFSEYETMEACDKVCYPTQHMGDVLKKLYPAFSYKLFLLPHAFEPDKFPNIIEEEKREGFIYGGSLYPGIEEYILQLANIIKANPHSGFKWNIYTGTDYPLIDSNFAKEDVQKHSFIPETQLFQNIKKSAAYLAFFPVTDKDLISTKFFEIIYTQTPILYIGEEGEVGKFIRENHLGVHILPENMARELPKYLSGNVPFKKDYFDVTQYTFSSVTDKFLSALTSSENEKIKISIIIPCYNVSKYISDCVNSAINQTYRNIEIICIDNMSTDNTWDILNDLKKSYPFLIIAQEEKKGAPAARNKGLSLASGQWIQFLDADDLLLPTKLKKQVALLKKYPDANLIVGSFSVIHVDGVKNTFTVTPGNKWQKLIDGSLGCTISNLFKKNIIPSSGWREQQKSSQEYKLMFDIFKQSPDVSIIYDDVVGCIYQKRIEGSITSNYAESIIRFLELRKEIWSYLENENRSDVSENFYLNASFQKLRVLFMHDKNAAIHYFKNNFPKSFIPKRSLVTPLYYIILFRLFGFEKVEYYVSQLKKKL